jgi:hypothetical protein
MRGLVEKDSAGYARATLDVGEGVWKEEWVAIVESRPGKEQRSGEKGEAAHEATHGRVPHSLSTVKAKYLARGRCVNQAIAGGDFGSRSSSKAESKSNFKGENKSNVKSPALAN